jgi:hypothetical protein
LVGWGAITAGGVLGLAILIALSALWLALAFGSDVAAIRDDLAWFLGGSAVMSLFLASYLAGFMQGVRGWTPGLMAGITLWAVTLVVAALGAVPTVFAILPGSVGTTSASDAAAAASAAPIAAPLWATFLSIVGTLLASAFGGTLGGATPRSEKLYAPDGRPQLRERDVQVRIEPEDDVARTTTTSEPRTSTRMP